MNEELPPFLANVKNEPVSAAFQQEVWKRVRRHDRNQKWIRNGIRGGVAALCAFFIGQQLALYRQGSRRVDTPRVASAERGVDWLLRNQREDGAWKAAEFGGSDRFGSGVTGLATLALLNSPDPVPPERIERAQQYLRDQWTDTRLSSRQGPEFYNSMLSLFALQEANKLYPHPKNDRILKEALHQWISTQHPDGGWGYPASSAFTYRETTTPNSAVTWWIVQLLERSDPLPGRDPALAKAVSWLEKRFENPALPQYRQGQTTDTILRDALYWMARDVQGDAQGRLTRSQRTDSYRDYLRSQVEQPDDLLQSLRESQAEDGSWNLPEDRWWKAGGQVYVTALRVLAQVPREG